VIAVLTVDFDQTVSLIAIEQFHPLTIGNEVWVENSLEVAYCADLKFLVKPLFA
jgi:hypothetical protein